MSDLSKEIRKHATNWPSHLRKRINCQRLLEAAEEIERLETENKRLRLLSAMPQHEMPWSMRWVDETNRGE